VVILSDTHKNGISIRSRLRRHIQIPIYLDTVVLIRTPQKKSEYQFIDTSHGIEGRLAYS
jgi:hypothetical protein